MNKRYNFIMYNIPNLFWNNAAVYFPYDIEEILRPLEVVATSDTLKLKAINLIEFEITSDKVFNFVKAENIDNRQDVRYYIARPGIWKDNSGQLITYNLELDCFNTFINRNKTNLRAIINKTANLGDITHSFDLATLNYIEEYQQAHDVSPYVRDSLNDFYWPFRGPRHWEKPTERYQRLLSGGGFDVYEKEYGANFYESYFRFFRGPVAYQALKRLQSLKLVDYKILTAGAPYAQGRPVSLVKAISKISISNEEVTVRESDLTYATVEGFKQIDGVGTHLKTSPTFPVHDWDRFFLHSAFVLLLKDEYDNSFIFRVSGVNADIWEVNQRQTKIIELLKDLYNRPTLDNLRNFREQQRASHILYYNGQDVYIHRVGETPLINVNNFISGIIQQNETDQEKLRAFQLQEQAGAQAYKQQTAGLITSALTAPAQLALLAATGGVASPLLAAFNIATNLIGAGVTGSFLSKTYQRQQEANQLNFLNSNLKTYNNNLVPFASSKQFSNCVIAFLNLSGSSSVNQLFEVIDDKTYNITYSKGWYNFKRLIIPEVNSEYLKHFENRDIKII